MNGALVPKPVGKRSLPSSPNSVIYGCGMVYYNSLTDMYGMFVKAKNETAIELSMQVQFAGSITKLASGIHRYPLVA